MASYKNSEPVPPIMRGSPPPPEQRVPWIDWDRPPWNRWAFQHMSQVLRTAPVYRSRDPAFENKLEYCAADYAINPTEISFERESGARTTLEQFLDDTYTDGFLVLHEDRVIAESYYNGMTPYSVHLGQSVTKSIVATAAACLIEEGLMDVDAPVSSYLPELAQTGWRGATLQQVLDMTTGVRFDETYHDRDSDVGKTDVACGWKPPPEGLDTSDWPDCVWDQILTLSETDAAHGNRFYYRSIETEVLGFAMERVTGQRLAEVISERLWAPMGAEEDALLTVDKLGCATASGGFNASLRDYARFGKLLLNQGIVNNRRVVPQFWIDDIRRGKHGLFSEQGRESFPDGCYRNQFWIEDVNEETHVCLGVFGQMIYISPKYNLVAVKLSTWPEFLNREWHRDSIKAIRTIAEGLL